MSLRFSSAAECVRAKLTRDVRPARVPRISALDRRTSTLSVKAFFSPLSFESRVSCLSSQIHHQVDHGIHDVISDGFVTMRSQARMRDEELFQLR